MFDVKMKIPEAPLHRAEFEHDNCGIGAVVNIKGIKTHETVENALKIERKRLKMEHFIHQV